jgi:hypothetical protein
LVVAALGVRRNVLAGETAAPEKRKTPRAAYPAGPSGLIKVLKQKDQISSLPPNPNGPEEEA